MSLYESRIDQARRDLTRLRERAARASKTIAEERSRAADNRARAARSYSPSSYLKQASTAEDRAVRAEKERASIDSEIARREKQLFDAQAALEKERARADQQRAQTFETRLRELNRPPLLRPTYAVTAAPESVDVATVKQWDFFVSHATPDKESIARPLAEALRAKGASVWFDEFELTVGDSLRGKIDEGLAKSRYGIVVLTQAYLAGRQWTENELNGLFAGNKRILPIWHNVSHDEVHRYSPMLADRVALATALQSLDAIVGELIALLSPGEAGTSATG